MMKHRPRGIHTTIPIGSLVDKVNEGELNIPVALLMKPVVLLRGKQLLPTRCLGDSAGRR